MRVKVDSKEMIGCEWLRGELGRILGRCVSECNLEGKREMKWGHGGNERW